MDVENTLAALKEAMTFLLEQEKVRASEIEALNSKIEAVNNTLINDIINPANDAYNEEQFNNFDSQYGERLNKYDDTIKLANGNEDYSSSREAWNEMQNLPDEEKNNLDVEGFVNGVESGLKEYVDKIKSSLGLPEETAVEINSTPEGEVEVKADTTGDGEPDTVVTDETTKEEEPKEEIKEEVSEEEVPSEDEIDPELKKQLEEWSKK